MNRFEVEAYTLADKDIIIYGPDDLKITVNYDDVDHLRVEKFVYRLVGILNDHWAK